MIYLLLDYVSFMALSVGWLDLNHMMHRGQCELIDFGPSVDINRIAADGRRGSFQIDAFKKFISGIGTQTPKRGLLGLFTSNPEILRPIFLATIEVFGKATKPLKMFHSTMIDGPLYFIKQLAERVKAEKILEFVGETTDQGDEKFLRMFRTIHPTLKLEMKVAFQGRRITGINFVIGTMTFKVVDIE